MAASVTEAAKSGGGTADGTGDGSEGDPASENEAAKAEEELKIALSEQIDKGLLNVEREGDKEATVGSAGSFPSGSATLHLKQET